MPAEERFTKGRFVEDQVAHEAMIKNTYFPGGAAGSTLANESEAMFIGKDCYVPRLVAAPMATVQLGPRKGLPSESYYAARAEPLASKRPLMTAAKDEQPEEPRVFPKDQHLSLTADLGL
mmetsp:Transcript_23027/g.46662  ORF Transcript_23027/g.46662 Transcript_23027/m.46662 type:complete len:120 (-) Transcript_23027:116-475(-)|eukprot:CAMPEP_0113823248 /NCGR_PEP_ID=MMETSP0328-20130328/2647_1 /TAXON_ID=39455 /ORGANISM="Alexandrium minutum" /LENGTH=119 /DNA_ID=CAMNT_0000791187 /DNA_START=95 /DNA_END=454 /DNA_ORIENTATION=+ /assembly_acc=CAM_ASM_000350